MAVRQKTEAEKRAQAKYDKEHKEQFKSFHLKYGLTDPENAKIVAKLSSLKEQRS